MHAQVLFGVNQRLRVEDVDSPLVNVRPVKSVLLVIVTGDRGLCGGYNNFVLKKVGGPACPSPCACRALRRCNGVRLRLEACACKAPCRWALRDVPKQQTLSAALMGACWEAVE